ncbi:hypothetical protein METBISCDRAFT_12719 [Metschnikowia bicuspidata]|uniref:C2H2-type domain-containing protein n=1 Tax=Metschnikowia bicuspidata TaxID=27322 RepID=A0A4P9ZG67_9ASCO|nr:hypothetical protein METBISCDRAFT_12719 [Metschnikowia bicuspidata]
MKPSSPISTHGYAHGHVHHHRNHVHIHGHIHNHDHVLPAVDGVGGDVPGHAPPDTCKHFLDELDMCGDISCEELDDCYFDECEPQALEGLAYPTSARAEGQAGLSTKRVRTEPAPAHPALSHHSAPQYLQPSPVSHRHAGSLCEMKRTKVDIFENLIDNVLQNAESEDGPLMSPVLLHFPHHCHSDAQRETDSFNFHTVHQLCFHAKVPVSGDSASDSKNEDGRELDFNFFVQLDNIHGVLDPPPMLPDLPHDSFSCQWDSCAQPLDNTLLVQHVVDAHLKPDLPKPQLEFECAWSHCDFLESDFNVFLEHLLTHGVDLSTHVPPAPKTRLSTHLKPQSIEPVADLPHACRTRPSSASKKDLYPLNITKIKIQHKQKPNTQIVDANFTCRWHIGKTQSGEPIICNKTHLDEGSLQAHLQSDHIGLRFPIYHCCWDGCERHNGKVFIQRQKLLRHIHIHTGHKPCKCTVCGSLFAVPAVLKQHMRIHSGERPYQCTMCDKRFATSSSLAIHTRVHLGLKPLQCLWPGCGRFFRERSNLAKHLKTHRTYTCAVCQATFDKKKDYANHCKMHPESVEREEIAV